MNILVFGLGKSGKALLGFYKDKADLWVYDDKKSDLTALQKEFGEIKFYDPGVSYDLLALSPGPSLDHPLIKELTGKGVQVKGELEIGFENLQGDVLAITGTNGKTTTTSLVKAMVEEQFPRVFAGGNIGIPLTGYAGESQKGDIYVVEVSSFQLETITEFSPKISLLLNITPDHISWHGSMEKYVDAKFRLWENNFSGQIKIINADQEFLLHETLKRFGSLDDFYLFSTQHRVDKGAFLEKGKLYLSLGEKIELLDMEEMTLKGDHNISNALAAALMAALYGVKAQAISRVLRTFKSLEHRYEILEEKEGRRFINDSKATNIDSALPALKSAQRATVLIAGGMDKKVPLEPFYENWNPAIKYLILFGETKFEFARLAEGVCTYYVVENLDEAFAKAMELSSPGWDILLSPACASWDMYENFEARGEHFKRLHGRLQCREK